jgi:ABC-type multidrug transport system ATPase subunit
MKTPELIFMDEVSNGVDPITRKNLYAYLKQMRHTSTLIITHRIDEAEKICDIIATMCDGQFLDCDDPKNLKEKHGQVYILQVEPTVGTAMSIQKVHELIAGSLAFCKRIYAIQEDGEEEDYTQMRSIIRKDLTTRMLMRRKRSYSLLVTPTTLSTPSSYLTQSKSA